MAFQGEPKFIPPHQDGSIGLEILNTQTQISIEFLPFFQTSLPSVQFRILNAF